MLAGADPARMRELEQLPLLQYYSLLTKRIKEVKRQIAAAEAAKRKHG